jgi:sugar diacid utilization regulator
VEWLIKNLKNEVQVVFLASQVDYFESAKPHLFIHFETYDYREKKIQELEDDYNKFYRSSSLKNIKLKDS